MQVRVYRNLHKDCWSVVSKLTNRVELHVNSLYMSNCSLHVGLAGMRRVRREKRKNVHAFIKGDLMAWSDGYIGPRRFKKVKYDPYKDESFVYASNGRPVYRADAAILNKNGLWIGKFESIDKD